MLRHFFLAYKTKWLNICNTHPHLTHDWTLFDGGKEQPHHAVTLERK
jgi:hypothetical protein